MQWLHDNTRANMAQADVQQEYPECYQQYVADLPNDFDITFRDLTHCVIVNCYQIPAICACISHSAHVSELVGTPHTAIASDSVQQIEITSDTAQTAPTRKKDMQ